MCIVALDTRHGTDERINREVLGRCYEKNPHSIGMMWPWEDENGNPTLRIWKTLNDFNGMWDRYTTVRDAGGIVAIHFRKTSVGDDSIENAHPFLYRDHPNLGFMHNGTIKPLEKIAKKLDGGISDTRLFQRDVFNKLPPDWIKTPALYNMVYNFVGRSRLLFMDAWGNYTIMNERIGYWWPDDYHGKHAKRHVWFSHTKEKTYIQTGSKSYIMGTGYTAHAAKGNKKESKSGKADSEADTNQSSSTSSDQETNADGTDGGTVSRSSDSFYRRRAHHVQTEGYSREAREVNWIFEYGDFQRGIEGSRHGLEYVGEAWMPGAQLWRVADSHFDAEIAGVVDSDEYGDIVVGSLYKIDAPLGMTDDQVMEHIDAQEGHWEGDPDASYFHRYRAPVYWTAKSGTNIVYPWVYYCNVAVNDTIERIKHGSWSLHLEDLGKHPKPDPEPDDHLPAWHPDIEDPWYDDRDSPQCPRCNSYNTLAVEDYIEGFGYVEGHVYCKECQREFDSDGHSFIRPVR